MYIMSAPAIRKTDLPAPRTAIEKAPELKADVAKFDVRICKKKGELEKAEKRKMNLYEDLKDGIITKKEYLQLKTEYDRRIGEAEMLIRSYEKEASLILESRSSLHEWARAFKEYTAAYGEAPEGKEAV